MAHKLADKGGSGNNEKSKELLNRREYVKAGAAVTALMVGTGSGVSVAASAEGSTSFSTGFGEYI